MAKTFKGQHAFLLTLEADLNVCSPHYMGELDSNLQKTRADMSKRTKKISKAVKEMAKTSSTLDLAQLSKLDKAMVELQESATKLQVQAKLLGMYVKERSTIALTLQDCLNRNAGNINSTQKGTTAAVFIYGMMQEIAQYEEVIRKSRLIEQIILVSLPQVFCALKLTPEEREEKLLAIVQLIEDFNA